MSECTVKIFGRVERLREDGATVAVPFGIYTMELLSQDSVRLSGRGLPTFELDRSRVAGYMGLQMKVVSGECPGCIV
jgi:hypothetical protein